MRLFVAVLPPDAVLDRLAAVPPRPDRAGVRWTSRDQWHITLRFLGELADAVELAERLRPVIAGLPAGRAVLGPAVELLNPRIVSVPVAGLDTIAVAVVDATRDLGRPPEDRPFRGHITVARLKGLRSGAARALTGASLEARWDVTDVHIMQSRLSPHGASYESVAAIRLSG
ncbi:MAG: RNA 2',3'-cyclic phosphodiesterase [Acidimicrobiales bacterium]